MKMMDFDPGNMTGPTVQRKERSSAIVSRGNLAPMPTEPKDPELDSLLADLDAEMAPEGEAGKEAEKEGEPTGKASTEAQAGSEGEPDISKIMAKYNGKPEELAKALLNMQKLTGQKDAQIQLLTKATQGQPTGQPGGAPQQPIMGKVEVNPWDAKKVGDKFLDDIPGSLDSLRTQMLGTVQAHLDQIMGPVYSELVEARLDREFPGVMTKESIPIIKVLAQSAEGQTILDKYRAATKTYQETYGTPLPKGDNGAKEEKPKVGQPGATAKPTGKRVYYRDEFQRALHRVAIGSPEHIRLTQAMQKAYKEGRVKESRLT